MRLQGHAFNLCARELRVILGRSHRRGDKLFVGELVLVMQGLNFAVLALGYGHDAQQQLGAANGGTVLLLRLDYGIWHSLGLGHILRRGGHVLGRSLCRLV